MENQYNYYNPDEPNSQQHKSYQSSSDKQRRKTPKVLVTIGLAVVFGVVSSATFMTANLIGNNLLGLTSGRGQTANSNVTAPPSPGSSPALTKSSNVVTSDVSDIVEVVKPSVVSITNLSVQQVQDFFGSIHQQASESAGTGIIIAKNDDELLLVTNNHVVEGSDTLTVTFNDGSSVEANIKGTDPLHDLAVIAVAMDSISNETMDAISVATLGDSTQLRVGEPAIAIGNALGYGQSVTTGVISALNRGSRAAQSDQGGLENGSSNIELIQTDAAINPGNSGGPLVNANGEVIGINSSKLVGATVEGVGYAIPVSDVSDIITDLMNQETRTKVAENQRGFLGISGVDVTEDSAQRYGMPQGVYVSEVAEGGGASNAGLMKGSVITGFNGQQITSMVALQNVLQYYKKGETVSLTIQVPESNGEYTEQILSVVLGARIPN